MDAYPPAYVQHNLPFIVLSGLGAHPELDPPPSVHAVLPGRAATRTTSEIPPVAGDRADQLLQDFLAADATNTPWNTRSAGPRDTAHGFRIRAVGRDYVLPPKKADAPTTSETTPPGSPTIAAATSWILHSPISPLSPAAPTFPDGVMVPSWVAKHQDYIPSVFISFFDFTTDPVTNSLHDNLLKTEINKIKAQFQKSEHRTRYVVVLLSNKTILEAPDIEERLAVIRRATGLDPKNSLFFLPPNTSPVELRAFVTSVLTTLQPVCVEYYRDLTKHARRKKGRGNVPPPTAPPTRGTSQTLSHPGWGVRYDFKLGVFAEFRQEMDAAQRHYSTALEALFGSEGIFETTASWSPRWDELRLLADTIAFRHIRCQLWNHQLTSAAQTWLRYKARLQDVLDRRSKGTSNYGWKAWESTWAQLMAQLIQRAKLPVFNVAGDAPNEESGLIYALPEKQFLLGEKLPPWELLHHAGYWHKLSADYAKKRYILARDMPEEDRTPPGMSPAAKVSSRNQTYDYFLVPQPHEELPLPGSGGKGFQHWSDISTKLEAAVKEFKIHGQQRKVDQLRLETARTMLHVKRYDDAFKVLRPLWTSMSWRSEGWWNLASEVLWALHECALRVSDRETYIATEWELYNKAVTGKTRYKYDLMSCLDAFQDESSEKVTVSLDTKAYISCVSVHLALWGSEGNVGEPLRSQIVVTSTARPGSSPITLSSVQVQFKGGLSEVQLTHVTDEASSTFFDCTLEESAAPSGKPKWTGTADLTLQPGQTKVYNFLLVFREAGDVEAVGYVFEINTDKFDLVCSTTDLQTEPHSMWWIKSESGVKPRKVKQLSGITTHILPKPPKMEIRLPDVREQYFTDEPVTLSIEVSNQEEEETEAVLEVRLLGRSKDTLGFAWVDRPASSPMKEVPPALDGSTDVDLPGHVVGRLVQGERTTEKIRFIAPADPADYALEVKVIYHLLSDRDIPISKIMIADLVFNAPFEASYDLNARVHPDPWPSYFELQEAESNSSDSTDAFGIAQKWGLRAKVASFADEQLVVKDLAVTVHGIHGGATCDAVKEFAAVDTAMNIQELHEWSFSLDIRKNNLEERRSTALDTTLDITWQRTSWPDAESITSSLPIPRIQIPSSEPRVLASAAPSPTVSGLIYLEYTVENPTMHFLTFEFNMEASEEFGFSGPKLRLVHMLPMSRQTVTYNILPLVAGVWINPSLKVMDKYFNKVLRVQATEGLRQDKNRVEVWVPGEGSEQK